MNLSDWENIIFAYAKGADKLCQGLCFFATLIENFPALIENLQRFSI